MRKDPKKNQEILMFVQNLKEGDFIFCCDDKDKKYHDSYEYQFNQI